MSISRFSWLVAAKLSRSITYPRARTIYLSSIKSLLPVDGRFIDERVQSSPSILTQNASLLRICKRHKSGKKKTRAKQEEDSEDEDDDDLVEDSNNKVNTTQVSSMRVDLVIKSTLGMARNKAEVALYESRIRINGRKVLKKSTQVCIGDRLDLIRGPSPKNPNFLLVSRVTLLAATVVDDAIKIKFSRDKSLLIDQQEYEEETQ